MTSVPVIKIGEPRELLALVPFQLGVEPRDSLVVVSVRARDRCVGLVARVDLEAFADDEDGVATADFLAVRMAQDEAAQVVVVVYTDRTRAEVADPATLEGRAVGHLLAALWPGADGGVWVVGPTGYGSLRCQDASCCPPEGRPVTDLQATVVGAHMVAAGFGVVRDRSALRVQGEAGPDERRRAGREAAAERRRRRTVGREHPGRRRPGGFHLPPGWGDAMLLVWFDQCARVRDGLPLAPEALGRLLAALEVPLVRDALVLAVAEGRTAQHADCLADALGGLGGAAGDRPDQARADDARGVLEAVVRHTSGRARATPLATLACLEWWSGNGARANVLVEQCLEADGAHRLGLTLLHALAAGLAPGWVNAEPAPEDGPQDEPWDEAWGSWW